MSGIVLRVFRGFFRAHVGVCVVAFGLIISNWLGKHNSEVPSSNSTSGIPAIPSLITVPSLPPSRTRSPILILLSQRVPFRPLLVMPLISFTSAFILLLCWSDRLFPASVLQRGRKNRTRHRSQPAMAGEFFCEFLRFRWAITGGWVQAFGGRGSGIQCVGVSLSFA